MTTKSRSIWPDLFILSLLFIPLWWGAWDKSYWHDELYSIYYSFRQWKALKIELHSPLVFGYLSPFTYLFGAFSPLLSLSSILPSILVLSYFYFYLKNKFGQWVGICLVTTFTLNPVFLHFARSPRPNIFIYLIPILLWCLLEQVQKIKHRNILVFFTVLLGGLFHYYLIPALVLLVLIYYLYLKKEVKNFWGLLGVTLSSSVLALLMLWGKYYFFMEGRHIVPFSSSNDLEGVLSNLSYYFNFAHEGFSIQWSKVGIAKHVNLYSYFSILMLLAAVLFVYFRARKILIYLFVPSIICFAGIYLISRLGYPVFSARNYLFVFGAGVIVVGTALAQIKNKMISRLSYIGFVVMSIYHLDKVQLHRVYPQEVALIRDSGNYFDSDLVVSCDYPEKYELVLNRTPEMDCDKVLVELKNYKKIIVVDEFFGNRTKEFIQKITKSGFVKTNQITKNYSSILFFQLRE